MVARGATVIGLVLLLILGTCSAMHLTNGSFTAGGGVAAAISVTTPPVAEHQAVTGNEDSEDVICDAGVSGGLTVSVVVLAAPRHLPSLGLAQARAVDNIVAAESIGRPAPILTQLGVSRI